MSSASARAYYEKNGSAVLTRMATYYQNHREARLASRRRYVAAHPERVKASKRNATLRRNYGITATQFAAMADAQNRVCAVCSRATELVVDHDHTTGRVRGLLCNSCNGYIGVIGERREVVKALLAYLDSHLAA